jgi:hypothetical protein
MFSSVMCDSASALPGASASLNPASSAPGSSSSGTKCRTANSWTATGWLKSISSRTAGPAMMPAGSRRSPRTAATPLARSSRMAWGVHDDDGVAVHVDDPRVRVGGLRDLVDVGHGGQARADVEELPDAPLGGEEMDDPAEEGPVRQGRPRASRDHGQDLRGRGAIGVEVVLPAKNVVIDPGHVRHRDVQPASGQPVLLPHVVHAQHYCDPTSAPGRECRAI